MPIFPSLGPSDVGWRSFAGCFQGNSSLWLMIVDFEYPRAQGPSWSLSQNLLNPMYRGTIHWQLHRAGTPYCSYLSNELHLPFFSKLISMVRSWKQKEDSLLANQKISPIWQDTLGEKIQQTEDTGVCRGKIDCCTSLTATINGSDAQDPHLSTLKIDHSQFEGEWEAGWCLFLIYKYIYLASLTVPVKMKYQNSWKMKTLWAGTWNQARCQLRGG